MSWKGLKADKKNRFSLVPWEQSSLRTIRMGRLSLVPRYLVEPAGSHWFSVEISIN